MMPECVHGIPFDTDCEKCTDALYARRDKLPAWACEHGVSLNCQCWKCEEEIAKLAEEADD